MSLKIHIQTIGCRTNTAESSLIAEFLEHQGFTIVSDIDTADVLLLNSCTVTHGADRDVGKSLRRARRQNPKIRTVVSGCLPTAYAGHRVLEEADACVSGNAPHQVLEALLGHAVETKELLPRTFPQERTDGQSRVHIKIGEGCDHRCSYCIVPMARGNPRSVSPGTVLSEVENAAQAGFQEVVLTATHVLKYGQDLPGDWSLPRLMAALEEAVPNVRFRISSMEPGPEMEEVLQHVIASPRWCNHLHLALQNAADSVLKTMRRPYQYGAVAEALHIFRQQEPRLGIGMDIIVGFPGETEEDFLQNLERLKTLPFHYLHVFPYSPRPGTDAAQWKHNPSSPAIKERSAVLRKLSDSNRSRFARQHIGKTMDVLMERFRQGRFSGLTDNYLRTEGARVLGINPRERAKVLVTGHREGVLLAEIINEQV